MNRPANRPVCRHNNSPGFCASCERERIKANSKLKPLVDEWWEHRGTRDLTHQMYRAYRMGLEDARKEQPHD